MKPGNYPPREEEGEEERGEGREREGSWEQAQGGRMGGCGEGGDGGGGERFSVASRMSRASTLQSTKTATQTTTQHKLLLLLYVLPLVCHVRRHYNQQKTPDARPHD